MNDIDKVVIVTGGSRGLGCGLVMDLLQEGYAVVTCSRGRTPEIEALESRFSGAEKFLWRACDLGDEPNELEFFEAVRAWTGGRRLYGLVNNAGIAVEGILATFSNADSERMLRVNFLSALRFCRLVLRVLLTQNQGGRIVNISSIVGLRGYTGLAAYSATKAAMDALSRSLAREVGRRGITVNSVAPGYLETALSASLDDQQRRRIVNRTPLGRLGRIEDIVPVVRFLMSDGAAFLTGQTLVVDGGITC
jgi:3-oxoacyl-[acyl-carrier protein] reductase